MLHNNASPRHPAQPPARAEPTASYLFGVLRFQGKPRMPAYCQAMLRQLPVREISPGFYWIRDCLDWRPDVATIRAILPRSELAAAAGDGRRPPPRQSPLLDLLDRRRPGDCPVESSHAWQVVQTIRERAANYLGYELTYAELAGDRLSRFICMCSDVHCDIDPWSQILITAADLPGLPEGVRRQVAERRVNELLDFVARPADRRRIAQQLSVNLM